MVEKLWCSYGVLMKCFKEQLGIRIALLELSQGTARVGYPVSIARTGCAAIKEEKENQDRRVLARML
jgi:hypothetical protein